MKEELTVVKCDKYAHTNNFRQVQDWFRYEYKAALAPDRIYVSYTEMLKMLDYIRPTPEFNEQIMVLEGDDFLFI